MKSLASPLLLRGFGGGERPLNAGFAEPCLTVGFPDVIPA